jgi:flagellar biosynthetic protein FliO
MADLKMFLALSLILGLLFLLAYLLKRIGPYRLAPGAKGGFAMRIVSTLPLGERRYLLVVELADHHYFLGVTGQSIQLLQELHNIPAMPPPVDSDTSFESILAKTRVLLGGGKK